MNTTTRESIYRRAARNGDEQDAFSRQARAVLCAFQRAGVAHKTKTRASRRDRRNIRQELRVPARGHERLVEALTSGRLDVNSPTGYAGLLEAYDAMIGE